MVFLLIHLHHHQDKKPNFYQRINCITYANEKSSSLYLLPSWFRDDKYMWFCQFQYRHAIFHHFQEDQIHQCRIPVLPDLQTHPLLICLFQLICFSFRSLNFHSHIKSLANDF